MKGKSLKKRLSFVLAIMMVAAFVPTNMFVNAANSKALKKKNSVTSKKINLKRNALENSYAIKTLRINCDSFDKFLEGTPEEELVKVDKLFVGSMEFRKTSSKISAWGDAFYVDELSKRIYIGRALRADEVVTLKGEGRVLGKFKALVSGPHDLEVVQEGGDAKAFKVRLKGYFEPGVEGQKKYDSISGATGTVVQSQNSHVNVEVAYGENPKESDWKPIKETGLKPTKDSKVIIKNAKNITGRYNTFDGSINIEVAKEGLVQGDYPVSIEVHDGSGRVETSNEVIFRVYSNKTTLKEVCTEEKMEKETGGFKKLQGGDIYQWTQEPWQITDIGGDETFTVPKKLKLWYGSHESGLYGFLGRVIPEDKEQEQTLIVEKGTNLHIINMKILSGVKIVVKDGGMLSFDDSSLFGKIVVEKGGKFQMNYDAKNKKFTQGSSINGQLVLKDGAVINSSSIYSNANSVTDSNVARCIDWPVVKVEGKVTVE